jgi:hypothetical protein
MRIHITGDAMRNLKSAVSVLASVLMLCSAAKAATLSSDSGVLAATATLAQQLPSAQTFTVTTAGQVKVSLADLGAPAPLTSLQLLVSSSGASVGQLSAAGSIQIATQPGTYKVQVIGSAGATPGSFSVDVKDVASNADLLTFSGAIAATVANPATSALNDSFTIAQAGSYTITVTDRNFPVALGSIDLALLSGSTLAATIPATGCTSGNCNTATFNASAGLYTIGGFATAAGADQAGLYSITITGPTGAAVYSNTVPVGLLPPPQVLTLPAGNATLVVTDFATPAALAALDTILAQGGTLLAATTAPGSASVSGAVAGPAQLYEFARASSATPTGSYGVSISQNGTEVYEDARPVPEGYVTASGVGGYRFAGTVVSAGGYTLQLQDQAFPTAFASLRAVVSQGGLSVQALNSAGSTSVTLAAGPVEIVVLGTPPTLTANSLLGVSLAQAGGGTPIVQQSQGVGGLFHTQSVTLPAAGSYQLTLTDLQFPAAFAELDLAVTQGTALRGQIFGGGTTPLTFNAPTAGTYSLNVLARLAAGNNYGTWGYLLAPTPPAPTISLSAAPTSVGTSQTSSLTWSATNATSCTASGGWTGTLAISGTQTTAALTSDTTYTLTCVGPGGSSNTSVSVTVSAAASSKGGGGAFDLWLLAGLSALLWRRRAAMRV